jgi:hypothetical protein
MEMVCKAPRILRVSPLKSALRVWNTIRFQQCRALAFLSLLILFSPAAPAASKPPRETEVVIIGAGIVGASIAYHLSARGCTGVIVLEKAVPLLDRIPRHREKGRSQQVLLLYRQYKTSMGDIRSSRPSRKHPRNAQARHNQYASRPCHPSVFHHNPPVESFLESRNSTRPFAH